MYFMLINNYTHIFLIKYVFFAVRKKTVIDSVELHIILNEAGKGSLLNKEQNCCLIN